MQKFTSLQGIDFFPNLQLLACAGNQLTELDVSKNTALDWLTCEQNNLTSLDVSQTAVTTLCAAGNQIDINVEEPPTPLT